MKINAFRKKIKPNVDLIIENKKFKIREVIKFRFDDGNYYIKCFLNNGYVFADDEENNFFLLVKQIKTFFKQPFPKELKFKDKKFKFLFTAHAIAEKIAGEEIFKKGDSEKFWDYQTNDNSYLSLGINDRSGKRLDFYGRIVNPKKVNIE
jgi:hypothetical protein